MRIILIHGYKSGPGMNFHPWLRRELESAGHDVIAPQLPNADAPQPDEWIQALLEEVKYVDDQTIILGHSLGAPTALRFLEAVEARSTPKGCILVSPPWMIKSEQFRGFFLSELDFDVLMWKASRFSVVHARDDKTIPFDHAEKYARVLHARLVESPEGGHFTGEAYPIILDEVKKVAGEEIVYAPGKSLDDEFGELHER